MAFQRKSILCFSGREHHFQRLSPIMNELRKHGAVAKYLVSDNATNNDVAAEYLVPAREEFIHSADYLSVQDIKQVTSMTHEILREIDKDLPFEKDLRSYIEPFWWLFTAREAAEVVVSFRNLLNEQKPSGVMVLHTNNYWCKPLAYLCDQMGIPCFAFQEGWLRARDEKTMGKQGMAGEYCNRLLVWSEGAREAYLQAGVSEDKIGVVGIPHLDDIFRTMKQPDFPDRRIAYKNFLGYDGQRPLVTFAPPLLSRYDGNPNRAIGALLDWCANTFTQLAIRLHPFEPEDIFANLGNMLANHPCAKLIRQGDSISLAACSDLIISQHSTIATEGLAVGTPLAEIDLDNVGVLESLVDQGVAHRIYDGEMSKISDIISGKLRIESPKLDSWVDKYMGSRDGGSTGRVISEIERAINNG